MDAATNTPLRASIRKLSTVRVYAKLAAQTKVIDPTEATLIRNVAGYGGTEGKQQTKSAKAPVSPGTAARKRSMFRWLLTR